MSNSHDGWDQRWLALSRSTLWRSVFFATAMVGLIGLSTPGKTPITLAEGSSLLLADFENETGKPELASHLTQLLHLSLDQSQLVRICDPPRIEQAMRRMSLKPGLPITADLARQICQREGIPAYLLPGVSRLSDSFVLTARLVEVKADFIREAAADTVKAGNEGELLSTVDDLARRVRKMLGENYGSPSMPARALPPYSTSSTAALQLFAKALTHNGRKEYETERALLQQAVTLNPYFAAAQMRLASVLGHLGRFDDALKQIALAKANAQDLPPKEKYRVLGTYYDMNQLYQEAKQQYESLVALYPDDWHSWYQLADSALRMRDYSRSIEGFQRAIAIDKSRTDAHLALCMAFMLNRNMVKAQAALKQALLLEPQNPEVVYTGGFLNLVENELRTAMEAFKTVQAAQFPPLTSFGTFLVAQAEIYGGRLAESQATLEAGIEEDRRQGDVSSEADKRLTLAQVYMLVGNQPAALEQCRSMDALPLDSLRRAQLGIVFARNGSVSDAGEIYKKLLSSDTAPLTRLQLEVMRGEIASASGDKEEAMRILTRAKALPLGGAPSEPLARTLAELGRYADAEREYREICDRKAEMLFPAYLTWFSGTWTQALLEMGKCLLALNRHAEAQQFLRNYLWVMDGSDAGLASTQEAKSLLTHRNNAAAKAGDPFVLRPR